MAINPIFAARVTDQQECRFLQRDLFDRYIKSLKPGQLLKIVVKKVGPGDQIRSVEANSYYWAVVVSILADEFGYSKEEMHDSLGLMFRQTKDDFIPTIEKTSQMSSKRFWEYIEDVRRFFAMEYNITIPDPNQAEGDNR